MEGDNNKESDVSANPSKNTVKDSTDKTDQDSTDNKKCPAEKQSESKPESTNNSADNKPCNRGNGGKSAQPPRGKGYQEARRYDRDRRDNWRRGDKKGTDDGKGDNKSSTEAPAATNSEEKLTSSYAKKDATKEKPVDKKNVIKRDYSDKSAEKSVRSDSRTPAQSCKTPQKGREDRHDSGSKGGRKNDRGGKERQWQGKWKR